MDPVVTAIATNRVKFEVCIRWRAKNEPNSFYDGDSITTDNPLELPQLVESSRIEAKKRIERGASFGASDFKVVVITIAEVELD